MGIITRSAANNITTGGVILPAAINDASVASVTALAQVSAGDGITLISSQTASASASISFTSGIDSTYRTYLFKWINCHPATNRAHFQFNMSTDGGSSYNVTKTSTFFQAAHGEVYDDTEFNYNESFDLAQSTSYQVLAHALGNGGDEATSGELYLFSPSNTSFVKHFLARNIRQSQDGTGSPYQGNDYIGGYGNEFRKYRRWNNLNVRNSII
jgi:hypothetical protein